VFKPAPGVGDIAAWTPLKKPKDSANDSRQNANEGLGHEERVNEVNVPYASKPSTDD
jgi:hypothetical protein